MKTSHQFARELLAFPELPIYHFDPSLAGLDDEMDTSITDPKAEIVKTEALDPEWEVGYEMVPAEFITICAGQEYPEPAKFLELVIEILVAGDFLTKQKLDEGWKLKQNRLNSRRTRRFYSTSFRVGLSQEK